MDLISQNMFNQQPQLFPPGRVIARREVWVSPITKRIVELRWVTVTVEEQGIYKTDELKEIDPPLDDGTVPESSSQIRECWRCFSLITKVRLCPECGKEFCYACTPEIEKDGQKVRVCVDCGEKIKNPLWHSAKKGLWG